LHPFHHLPGYSHFLLDNCLDAFVLDQLRIARAVNVPMLQQLSHFSDEQLVEISKVSMTEYLWYLKEDKAKELIELSIKRWVSDQLEIIGKFELLAEDITLLNYVRGRAFRKYIPLYTKDVSVVYELIDEIDSFLTASTTAATDTYIILLKDQLARHEKELLDAQQIARMGSFEWDLTTNESKNSPETHRIFEMEEGSGVGNFMKFIHPEDVPIVEKSLEQGMQTGSFENEYRYLINDKVKFIWSKGLVLFENNQPIKVIGTVQDITRRKKAEQELLEKTIALERSNESLQQFAYVASHDLKEPIRKIATFTDMVLLKEANLSDSSRESLKKAYSSALRMRQLIDGIMAYSTLTQWEDKRAYNLNDIIKEVTDLLEQNISEKGAVIQAENLPEATVVPSQFRQLFQNLFANALKFSIPGKTPQITISHQWLTKEDLQENEMVLADKYLKIMVSDNGIGFKQEFASRIFTLFSRLHTKTEYEGSGLGLAIAKKIIDNHGGIIQASSTEGQGATFYFIIPQ
jgi:signal transduction histidine kinase